MTPFCTAKDAECPTQTEARTRRVQKGPGPAHKEVAVLSTAYYHPFVEASLVKLAIALLLWSRLAPALLHPYADSPGLVAFNMHVLGLLIGQIFRRSIFKDRRPDGLLGTGDGNHVDQLRRGHNLSGVASRTLTFTIILGGSFSRFGWRLSAYCSAGRSFSSAPRQVRFRRAGRLRQCRGRQATKRCDHRAHPAQPAESACGRSTARCCR